MSRDEVAHIARVVVVGLVVRQLHKRVLPESPRPKRALCFALAGFCLLFSGIGGLLVFANFH